MRCLRAASAALCILAVPLLATGEEEPGPDEEGAPHAERAAIAPPSLERDAFSEWIAIIQELLPRWSVLGQATWLFQSDVKGSDESLEMTEARFRLSHRFKVLDNLQLSAGASYSLRELHAPDSVGLPDSLHTVSADLGVFYRPLPRLLLAFLLSPGIRSDMEDVGGDDIRVPFTALTAYTFDATLTLVGGLFISGNHHRTVALPLIGLQWTPTRQWTMRISPLSPSVTFRPFRGLGIYASGQFNGGEWELEDGSPAGEALHYRDYRLKLGVAWTPSIHFTLDVNGGYAFARKFTFIDSSLPDDEVRLDSAPFVGAGATLRW